MKILFFCLLLSTTARIHELQITGDSRRAFHIESFGFNTGGVADLSIRSFGVSPLPDDMSKLHMGFVFRRVASESDAIANVEEATELGKCLLDDEKTGDKALADVQWEASKNKEEWVNGWVSTKRRRSNVAVIIVRMVFISAFFFYCLLCNHSFPTNPNRITNCFQLFSLFTTLQTTFAQCVRYF